LKRELRLGWTPRSRPLSLSTSDQWFLGAGGGV